MGNSAVKEHRLKNHPNREAKSTRGVHKPEHGDDGDDDDEDDSMMMMMMMMMMVMVMVMMMS